MRTSIVSVLTLVLSTKALAFDEYDNYEGMISARDAEEALNELFVREALADPSFKSFMGGIGNGLKRGASFISNHRGQILEGAETAAKFAPLLLVREAEPEADPGFRSFFNKAKSGVQNAGRYVSNHRGQILNGIGSGAKFAASMIGGGGGGGGPPADGGGEGMYRRDFDGELYAREYDDDLYARDPEAELYFGALQSEYNR